MSAITREEAEKFLSLVNAGMSRSAAARSIGRDRSGMTKAVTAFGMELGKPPPKHVYNTIPPAEVLALSQQGMTVDDIASRIGLSVHSVRDKLAIARKAERISFFKREEKPEKPQTETRGPWPVGHDLTWSAISDIPWNEAAARVASMRAV